MLTGCLQRLSMVSLAAAVLLPGVQAHEGQQPYECPLKVSMIDGNGASSQVSDRVIPIYRELGCQTEFVAKPGQRNLVEFNNGHSDGELMRLRAIEPEYSRTFVRSEVPLQLLQRGLWVHPDQPKTAALPVGYQLGVVWQKHYAENLANSLRFYDSQSMMQAYSNQQLRGFLVAYADQQQFLEQSRLQPDPLLEVELEPLQVYHYLGSEYAPFMKRFSELYQARHP